jgi:hypothetical protein
MSSSIWAQMKQLKVGLPDHLREELERAAAASGKSLADEVRGRLELSFESRGSDAETRALADAVDNLAILVKIQTGHAWHQHPAAHRALRYAVTARLARLKRNGEPVFERGPSSSIMIWARSPVVEREAVSTHNGRRSRWLAGRPLSGEASRRCAEVSRAACSWRELLIHETALPDEHHAGVPAQGRKTRFRVRAQSRNPKRSKLRLHDLRCSHETALPTTECRCTSWQSAAGMTRLCCYATTQNDEEGRRPGGCGHW